MAGKEAEIGALGIIVLVGVLGRLFLKKTGFSDVFLLLLFGAAVGALLPFESVGKMAELMLPIGAVTLLIIILNEGLHLPLKELLHLPKAVFFSILSFALSFAAAFSISYIFFQDVLVSLLIGAVFSSVAPELLSGFLSAREAHESAKAVAEIEATLSDALSVMLSLLLLSYLSHEGKPLELSVYEIGFMISLSCALGAVFAAGWKLAVPKIAEGNEHLAAIGIAAVLYAVSGLLHANGVISVFVFGFFLGNLSHKSVEEMRRFHSEISFFLRTAFFVYLGVLLFHSPKPMEVALFAAILSLLLAISRSLASKVSSLLEPSMRKGRLLEAVSGRGLTSAVLAVIVGEELHIYGHSSAVDFPLLALFVIFFTNAISAFLVFSNRKKE